MTPHRLQGLRLIRRVQVLETASAARVTPASQVRRDRVRRALASGLLCVCRDRRLTMSDGIYIGMAAAAARSALLDSISDNLANAQTSGFKKSEPAFQAFLGEARSPDPAFPVAVATSFD